jgi:hypothetical protein
MRTAAATKPVPGSTGPPGGPGAWHAPRLARMLRLVLWAIVILLLAGGAVAYGCAPAEVPPGGPVAAIHTA